MSDKALYLRLRAWPGAELGSGASAEQIRDAEKALGLALTGSYRRFVEELGWCGVGSMEVFGLGEEAPRHLELVAMTLSERTEMHPRLRVELLPLANDGGGNLYCLDTSVSGREPPVVLWDHEQDESQTCERCSDCFSTWLSAMIDEQG